MANHYDRILKENIDPLIPFLVNHLLGIEITHTETLKDKLQVTIETESDYVLMVHHHRKKFILHLEFQTSDHRKMPKRMLLYYAMLHHKYELSVRQFAIYLGRKIKTNMQNAIAEDDLQYRFALINLRQSDARTFLQSDQPEGVLLSILADFGDQKPADMIRAILSRLLELDHPEMSFEKYTLQLRILSQLRNLQSQIDEELTRMAIKIDIRKDPFYQKGEKFGLETGIEKGIEKGIDIGIEKGREDNARLTVINLLQNTDFEDEKIAFMTNVSVDFVRKIKKELEQ